MRTLAITLMAALMSGQAMGLQRTLMWEHDLGAWGSGDGVHTWNGQDGTGWALVMYRDGGDGVMSGFQRVNGITGSRGDDVIAWDDRGKPVKGSIQTVYPDPTNNLLYWRTAANVHMGLDCFTVVFNHSDADRATHYLIVDNGQFFDNSGEPPYGPGYYNAGSAAAGEWQRLGQQIPETNGLALWFTAESLEAMLSDGDGVASWYDDSGNGRNASQTNTASQPTFLTNAVNGLPAVRFDGANGVLGYDGSFLVGTDYTIFFVEGRRSGKSSNYPLAGLHGGQDRNLHIGYRHDAQFTQAHYSRDYNVAVPAFTTQQFAISSMHLDTTGGTGRQTYRGGTLLGGDGTTNQLVAYTDAQVGRYGTGTYYDGDIAEILIFDRYLDGIERNRIGYYLAQRYGIASAYSDPSAADIAVTIEADSVNATANGPMVYRITAVNNGFTNASAVVVSNVLPAALSYVSHEGGTYDSGSGDWSIGDLAYTVSTTLTVRATVKPAATGSVVTVAAGVESAGEDDPVPANNASSISVRVREELSPGDFAHRVRIDFPGFAGSGTLTNFPVLVVLNESIQRFGYDLFASAQGYDLRFAAANGTTMLYHDVEKWNVAGDSFVWVQVDALAAGSYIWAYFGNPSLTTEPAFETGGYAWEQDYIGVWHLCEQSVSDDAVDSGPLANTGVRFASPTVVNGVIAGGRGMLGGEAFTVGSGLDLSSKAFTLSSWAKRTAGGGNDNMWFGGGTTVGNRGLHCGFRGTQIWYGLYGDDGHATNDFSGDTVIWHHYTWVMDDSHIKSIYRDGIAVPMGGVNNNFYLSTGLAIGGTYGGTPSYRGVLDEVRASDAPRSADWIRNTFLTSASNATYTSIGAVQGPPRIENGAATNITGSSAFMNGELLFDAGTATSVRLLWGETDGGAGWGVWANTNSPNIHPVGPISTEITGLDELTSYSYTYYATNASGEAWATPSASFSTLKSIYWTITPSAGPNGAIDPADPQRVSDGADSPVFTFPHDTGYHLTNVVVDGVPIGVTNSYQFTAVTTNHTIEALFGINHYTVTVVQASNGEITPTGQVDVTHGSTPVFAVTPEPDYFVADILVDGVSVGPVDLYTLPPVTGALSITAVYTNVPTNMVMTSNLVLWLDGGSLSATNTEPVAEWYDLSGRGNHARQPLELMQPHFYGDKNGPHLHFDGAGDYMRVLNESQFDFQSNITVFVVGQHTSAGAWNPFIAKNGEPSGWQFREFGNSDGLSLTLRGLTGAGTHTDGPPGAGDIRTVGVFAGRYSGATRTTRLWHNGSPDGTMVYAGGVISTNDDDVVLAARSNGGIGGHAQCELYEVIVYENALADKELNSVGYYLQEKYAIDGSFLDPWGPSVATTRADPVRRNGATLHGDLLSTGSAPTTVWAVWDTADKGVTNPASWSGSLALGEQPEGIVSAPAGGMQSDTTYFYRFIVSNAYGVSWSPEAARFDTGVDPSSYSNSLRVLFTGYGGATPLTNFPALVTLSESVSNFSYETMASAYGADLRFTDNDQDQTLFYEIDTWARDLRGTSIGPSGAGSTSRDGLGVYTVVGQGNDIWNQTDSFHYAWAELPGDGAIEARVATYDNPGGNGWAKAGVMVRESLAADSAFVFMALRPAAGAAFQWRDTTAANAGWQDPGSAGAPPRWVRIERTGSSFVTYASTDGTNWVEEGRRDVAMATNVYIGLAVCSHVVGTATTVTFDNVGMDGVDGPSHIWVRVPELASADDYIWAFWGNPAATEPLPYTLDGSTWSEGFEGVYHLKEGSATSAAIDASMAGNDGAPTANPGVTNGLIGAARAFDGTHKFTVGSSLDLSDKAFTLSAWLYRGGDDAGDHMVFGGGANQNNHAIHCGFRDVRIWFGLYGNDGRCDTDYGGDKGAWHRYTWVLDDAYQKQIYRDGAAVPTIGTMSDFYKSAGLAIGAQHGGGTSYIGVLDEVRASPGVARSADWIQTSYSNQVAGSTFVTFSADPPAGPGTILIVR